MTSFQLSFLRKFAQLGAGFRVHGNTSSPAHREKIDVLVISKPLRNSISVSEIKNLLTRSCQKNDWLPRREIWIQGFPEQPRELQLLENGKTAAYMPIELRV